MASSSSSTSVRPKSTLPTLSHSAARSLLAALPTAPSLKGKERASPQLSASDKALLAEIEKALAQKDALQANLRKAKEELDPTWKPEGDLNGQEKRVKMLRQELAFLEASLQELKSPLPAASDPLLTTSPALLSFEADSKLSKLVEEMEQALAWEKTRGVKDRKDFARNAILLSDAEVLHKDLTKRVLNTRAAKLSLTPEEIISYAPSYLTPPVTKQALNINITSRAKAKSSRIAESFSELMNALVAFIDERMAGIGDEDGDEDDVESEKERKKNPGNIISYLRHPRSTASDRAHDLKSILELMPVEVYPLIALVGAVSSIAVYAMGFTLTKGDLRLLPTVMGNTIEERHVWDD
ncbi:hypothetical protein P7C70_g645, partial [Phenoliferia sp. Uapishka_3]